MSLVQDSLRAFTAGAAVYCIVYAATAVPSETHAAIDEFAFKPDTITVPVGTTVVWENKDDIPHTVVAVDKTFRSPHSTPTTNSASLSIIRVVSSIFAACIPT
jgi:plastocyanin